jgi:hypothetical protein
MSLLHSSSEAWFFEQHKNENLMDEANLALVFAPTLFRQKQDSDSLTDNAFACKLVKLLISNHEYFFGNTRSIPKVKTTLEDNNELNNNNNNNNNNKQTTK